ncbi:hypothetical protein WG954_18595 [Lacibacter sp. H375]|uniref:hypothetical protein n=1 Tax=Lacibacter sp. H375 TaxID=3133424 RepID=UPI0030BFCFD9
MKNNLLLLLLVALFLGCQKNGDNPDQPPATITDLKGKWKITATKAGPDSTNAQGLWTSIDYTKYTTINEIYCVNNSSLGKSFLSQVNCAYYESPGSIVGVVSGDCARTIFMRDTVWNQLIDYGLELKEAAFDWKEAYRHSKYLNVINQQCSSIQYIPEATRDYTRSGTWSFDEATQMISVEFINSVNAYNGETKSKFKVTKFTGSTVELQMQGSVNIEFRLQKQ